MPSYRGELPGMVWDPVKERYFAIQSAPNATNPQYTDAAVRASHARSQKEVLQAEALGDLEKQTVRRKALGVWESTRLNGSFARSTRGRPNALSPAFPFATSLAAAFEPDDKKINLMTSGFWYANSSYSANPLPPMRQVEAFDYDDATGTLVVGHSTGQHTHRDVVMYLHDVKIAQPDWLRVVNFALLAGSSIVGMAILPNAHEIIATAGSELNPAIIHVQPPSDPAVSSAGLVFSLAQSGTRMIRCSAASPFDTTVGTFAVGTDNGVLIPDLNKHIVQKYQLKRNHSVPRDIFALDFLSQNAFVGGMNHGRVKLWDLRTEESVFRIGHPSAVRSLKRADCAERLIVRGTTGELNMYDLRFVKEEQQWPTVSHPYLVFPMQELTASGHVGIDVSTELGLLAIATSPNQVSLYNLRTGKSEGVAQTTVPKTSLNMALSDPVHTIRFKNDDRGTPMMIVANGEGVLRLTL